MHTLDLTFAPVSGFRTVRAHTKNGTEMFPIHFNIMVPGVGVQMICVWVKDGDGFDTLEEAIASVATVTKDSHPNIIKLIARDYGMGNGRYYPELNAISVSSWDLYARPFAEYETTSGKRKYVCHPRAALMIHLIEKD